jgi:hypothetical protein
VGTEKPDGKLLEYFREKMIIAREAERNEHVGDIF